MSRTLCGERTHKQSHGKFGFQTNKFTTSGKPPTWLPLGKLVEQVLLEEARDHTHTDKHTHTHKLIKKQDFLTV